MKIKHVYGNVLRIDIPLTIKIRTIEEGAPSEREEPFYPDATKGCIVELANNYNRKIEYNATIKDNIVHIEDIGKISIGQYKVTVKCYDAQGNPYRYMVRDIVEICDATADAGIEAGVEFNAETYTLEGAVFVSYGVEQVQADWEEEDETSKAFIKNKPDVYTKTETNTHITQQVQAERERAESAERALGQAIGTKQDAINDLQEIRQGAQLGATAIQEEQDPTVPQWAKAANKPSYNANEVGALPSTTKYGSTIDMVLNSTTYVLTLTLKDQDGNSLNSKSVDLPLESVVVDGRYDAASKKIILTLQSGSALDIPVGDLVAGLQSEITSVNMLDADLVDDTNSAHKFVSAQEKETWNNKSDFSGSYNDLTDKPVIPVVPTNVSAFNNDAGYLTQHQDISGKVDKIEGKGLSTNDYTDAEKEKLAELENYDDTQVRQLINEEKTARQQGDNALSESVTQEETRAKGVEQNLDSKIGVNTAAITAEKTRAESVEQTLQLAIDTINGKIPAQATSQNQLADKDFVNSSVSTATADFKGTYNSLEDLEQVTANANDYAFVIANDAAGNTLYKRYKWVEGTGWVWEYDLNNSSFTQVQWAAIQSGITAALVTKLSDLPDNSTLNQRITQAIANALLNYYTKSEIDAAIADFITASVDNLVNYYKKSETYTKQEVDAKLATKQDALTFDPAPKSGSTNPVTSGGIKKAIDAVANTPKTVGVDFKLNADTIQWTNVYGTAIHVVRFGGVNIASVKVSYGSVIQEVHPLGEQDFTVADGQTLTLTIVRTADVQQASLSMAFVLA